MHRLTKSEIQSTLLAGRELAWNNAAGKRESIELKDTSQRRLFAFLLHSPVREPKNLPDLFVSDLSAAYLAGNDPASETGETAATARSGPWRLQRIETDGFGGLNLFKGPTFSYDFDGESLILQGPNGSGKSSLVGAVLWAIRGARPRDHASASPEDRAEVYDNDHRKIGTWPPIACYPDEPSGFTKDPFVRVTPTFVDARGSTALVERRLENGLVTSTFEPAFSVPEVLIETGLLMPSRMPQIRFEKGSTPLTRVVQSLTGLDDLIDAGTLVDGLSHKGREYLSFNDKQVQHFKTLFDSALEEAQRNIRPTGESIQAFQPKDTSDAEGPFAKLGKRLRTRAAELTQVISDDLVDGLNVNISTDHQKVAGAIAIARDALALGLRNLPSWNLLSALGLALNGAVNERLQSAVIQSEAALAEAIAFHERAQSDTRFQLKAAGAHWHEANRGATELSDCPLCDQRLDDLALKAEIEALRKTGEAASRQFTDNLNAIQAGLTAAVPPALASKLGEFEIFVPRQRLISELEAHLAAKPQITGALKTFVQLATEALASAPRPELVLPERTVPVSEPIGHARAGIAAVRRLLSLEEWRSCNAEPWERWWRQIADSGATALSGGKAARIETLVQHLARLSEAISEAEPYSAAADSLLRAWKSGREAARYQKVQAEREAITKQLAPLKSLSALAEAQARLAIETLSDEISAILKRMHHSERLAFKGAQLHRKVGLQVHGAFAADFKIDATLVANTSWLRAVLWAFLFAMRNEAVKQFGADALPLLILDDPQATFDAEHRRLWALEIVRLQQGATPTQVLLATHDETFVELVKNLDGVVGRDGIIVSAGPEIGHVGLFEGAALGRKWVKAQAENTQIAAQNYISEGRIYIEGLLRLMLRGQAADVNSVTRGFVIGEARNKIHEHNKAKLPPWDKPEFRTLVGQLDKGIPAIKFLDVSHHAGRTSLTMADAVEVEKHWRSNLEPALRRAFNLARDHYLIHGGLSALHAAEPDCVLPEGYTAKVKSLRFQTLGRAAALTGGVMADGRVDLDLTASATSPIVLGRHFAFRLRTPTLEPVARVGDILLVREIGEPSPKSLVVARCEHRVVARRFEIAENHSDIAVLTAQAINPRRIAEPIVIKKTTLRLHKIVGVIFDDNPGFIAGEGEVVDCGGESVLNRFGTMVKGVVEVDGQSAEPIALDGQMLIIGDAISADDALTKLAGKPVISGDGDGNRYFKRLRRGGPNSVVLESLEVSGALPPIILTHKTGRSTDVVEVWPVYGVLFEQ